MSELKTRFIDDTYVEYYNTGRHDLAQVYLKSEADAYIAELEADKLKLRQRLNVLDGELFGLSQSYNIKTSIYGCLERKIKEKDKEIAELKNQVHDYAQGLYVIQARSENEVISQKRKRCLAWAKWCGDVRELMHKLPVIDTDTDRRRMSKCKWCRKWRNRWLAIADKFKEAK